MTKVTSMIIIVHTQGTVLQAAAIGGGDAAIGDGDATIRGGADTAVILPEGGPTVTNNIFKQYTHRLHQL